MAASRKKSSEVKTQVLKPEDLTPQESAPPQPPEPEPPPMPINAREPSGKPVTAVRNPDDFVDACEIILVTIAAREYTRSNTREAYEKAIPELRKRLEAQGLGDRLELIHALRF